MIAMQDIKAAIDLALTGKTGYKVYGREVVKGFDRPSFFVELLPGGTSLENQNFTSNRLTIIITYYQIKYQERGYRDRDNLNMFDTIKGIFLPYFVVGTRALKPQNFRANYMGEQSDILQVSFDLDYFDASGYTRDTETPMETLKLNINP